MKTLNQISAKSAVALISSCGIVLLLTGCGGGGSSSKPPTSSVASSVVSSSVPSSDPASSSSSDPASSSSSSSSSLSSLSSASSSSSVSSVAPVSTTYKVTVEVPEGLQAAPLQAAFAQKTTFSYMAAKAVGPDTLTAENFAVACVDLAGVILEIIPLTENSVSPNDDGSWNITVPLAPSVNCLVVANLYQPLNLEEGESIYKTGNIYAPNSAETLTVSPFSTVAFNNFVEGLGGAGTFESANIDPRDPAQITAVDNVMTNIAALLASQNFSESTLAELLSAIELIIAPVIEQEVINIQNPVVATAVELIRDNGGMYNFSSRWEGIIYTALVGNTTSYGFYENGKFASRDTNWIYQGYILSSTGWVETSGIDALSSYNSDGSVTYVDSNADGRKTIIDVTQGFSLAGSNIANVLLTDSNTTFVSDVVNPDAVFSEGAAGYRISITYPQTYSIFRNTGEADGTCFNVAGMLPSDANGNCNQQEIRRDANIFERPVVAYASLFSADVGINAQGSRALTLGAVGDHRLDVQLINDSARTVKYYARSWEGTNYAALIATGTWTEFTLPTANGHNVAVRFNYPQSVLAAADIWSGQTFQAFTVQDGFVRHLTINPPSAQPSGTLVFNNIAKDNLMDAVNNK
jgi:hypothetical protein